LKAALVLFVVKSVQWCSTNELSGSTQMFVIANSAGLWLSATILITAPSKFSVAQPTSCVHKAPIFAGHNRASREAAAEPHHLFPSGAERHESGDTKPRLHQSKK
jgi:hypothetical protein